MVIHFNEDKQNERVDLLRKKEEEEFAEMVAQQSDMQYTNFNAVAINTEALRLVKEDVARKANLVVFEIADKKIHVAAVSFNKPEARTVLLDLESQGYLITPFITTTDGLQKAWNHYKDVAYSTESKAGALEVSGDEITAILRDVHSTTDITARITDILAQKKSYRISRVLEIIIAGALATKASDIHFEPEETYARLRYRLDGVLNDVLKFDKETFMLILARIKLLSGLKLNVRSEAQDGRFSVKINNDDIEIRTSLLPGAYSESIVLRILNPKSIAVPIEELGIGTTLFDILMREIAKPHGMILTTGPTGSGKTTTLYAFLRKIHTPEIKIITIEDPIEYHLPGIVQTQTNSEKGYTFLEGLRSALRQDPDVIMVGEIRDSETAEIAVNAAQTGHLVFSTLHTNTAAGTFPRLIDLGVNAKTMTSAINVSMAQRLVRKLCTACRKEVTIDDKTRKLIEPIIRGLENETELKTKNKIWQEVGCPVCNNTGFKGRVGVYEAILMDEAIEKLVRENPSEREIKKAAEPQKIPDMKQDGIMKVLNGTTSLEELARIIDLERE